MDLNKKIAARRRELESHPSSNFSEPKVVEARVEVEEKNIISEKLNKLLSIQEQVNNRRRDLDEQDNEIKSSENALIAKWFEENGSNITVEAVKRVSIATYGSMMIWSIFAIGMLFNHEYFDGANATAGGLFIFGTLIGFIYYAITKNKGKLTAEIVSKSTISNAGIIDNLKATSPISYAWLSILFFLFIVIYSMPWRDPKAVAEAIINKKVKQVSSEISEDVHSQTIEMLKKSKNISSEEAERLVAIGGQCWDLAGEFLEKSELVVITSELIKDNSISPEVETPEQLKSALESSKIDLQTAKSKLEKGECKDLTTEPLETCACEVGDIIEPYRQWNSGSHRWDNFPRQEYIGTKWRVLKTNLNDDEPHLTLQLVEGMYKVEDKYPDIPDIKNGKPGYVDDFFFPSISYRRDNPDYPSQTLEEFRVVNK